MPLNLTMFTGTEYRTPDYQSFAQNIILVIKNNLVKTRRKHLFQINPEGNFILDFAASTEVSESFAIKSKMIKIKLLKHIINFSWFSKRLFFAFTWDFC